MLRWLDGRTACRGASRLLSNVCVALKFDARFSLGRSIVTHRDPNCWRSSTRSPRCDGVTWPLNVTRSPGAGAIVDACRMTSEWSRSVSLRLLARPATTYQAPLVCTAPARRTITYRPDAVVVLLATG